MRYIREELLLVLGTSSSEAALPTLMQKMEKAGCSKSVVGLVVPTGYSFNLDGTNIYMTMAALFIAQACDIPLSLGDQILLLLVAMLSSKGAAGVTGAGFITLAATLSVVPSVPVAGMALILGVDRFMSECRALKPSRQCHGRRGGGALGGRTRPRAAGTGAGRPGLAVAGEAPQQQGQSLAVPAPAQS